MVAVEMVHAAAFKSIQLFLDRHGPGRCALLQARYTVMGRERPRHSGQRLRLMEQRSQTQRCLQPVKSVSHTLTMHTLHRSGSRSQGCLFWPPLCGRPLSAPACSASAASRRRCISASCRRLWRAQQYEKETKTKSPLRKAPGRTAMLAADEAILLHSQTSPLLDIQHAAC